MHKFFQKVLSYIFSSPYIYIIVLSFLLVISIIIIITLFRRKSPNWFKTFLSKVNKGFKIEKTQNITIGSNETALDSLKRTSIKDVEMKDSEINLIEGSVTLKDIKMENSYIGDIRSK